MIDTVEAPPAKKRTNGIRVGNPPFTVHTLVKSTEWNGFVKGDKVQVVDDPTFKYSDCQFEFMAHVTNIVTGATWVDLWGGQRKHEAQHSVRPNRVAKVDSRRKR